MTNRKQPVDYDKLVNDLLEIIQVRTGWMRRQAVVAVSVGLLIAALLCVTLSAEGLAAVQASQVSTTPTATPTLIPLPTSSADAVIAYLKQADISLADLKPLTVPNKIWQATNGTQFTVHQAAKQGAFLVLSYDTIQNAELDAFAASNDPKWKTWHMVQFVNILVLGDPGNDPDMEMSVEKELTQFLVASHRDLPTVNPTS